MPYDGGESTSKPPDLPHRGTSSTTATVPRRSIAIRHVNRRLDMYAKCKLGALLKKQADRGFATMILTTQLCICQTLTNYKFALLTGGLARPGSTRPGFRPGWTPTSTARHAGPHTAHIHSQHRRHAPADLGKKLTSLSTYHDNYCYYVHYCNLVNTKN